MVQVIVVIAFAILSVAYVALLRRVRLLEQVTAKVIVDKIQGRDPDRWMKALLEKQQPKKVE